MNIEKVFRMMKVLLVAVAVVAAALSVIAAVDVKESYVIGAIVWALIALAALRA